MSYSVYLGEGNGNTLQYSCLENPMDGGTWQATVHGVTKSQIRLSEFTFFSFFLYHSVSLFFKVAALDAFKTIYHVYVCVRMHMYFLNSAFTVSLLTFFLLILILLCHFQFNIFLMRLFSFFPFLFIAICMIFVLGIPLLNG